MPRLSPVRAGVAQLSGLKRAYRGKVRDTYDLGNDLLLVVATDAISIFDFVLNLLVLGKGIVLNLMSHFWMKHLEQFGFKNHLVAVGSGIDQYLPVHLRGNTDLRSRAVVVQKKVMPPIEFIVRIMLTGSGYESYVKEGHICGHQLPPGLQDGDQLPRILDTPTTKAQEGHDEHLSAADVVAKYPGQTKLVLQATERVREYAKTKGIILADTKWEISEDGVICDEAPTPDSSRFWSYQEWLDGRKVPVGRKAPSSFDKQIMRERGKELGINKLDPKNPDHVAKVHAISASAWDGVLKYTQQIYPYIFWRLAGKTIASYLREDFQVDVPPPTIKDIIVLCGSRSDVPAAESVAMSFPSSRVTISGGVISCHRNPNELFKFATRPGYPDTDAIICVGSKAFALPGIFDAIAYANQNDKPVIGVALGEPGSRELLAAQLSIEELPGTPVIMDEVAGKCYSGPEGLRQAIERVIDGELPPAKPRTQKPVEMGVFKNF